MNSLAKKSMFKLLIYSLLLSPILTFSQDVVINEIMASNQTTITDEDGDTPDWIELYNMGSVSINLSGYALSDDSLNTSKWIFQNESIGAGEYLLIFASDKDRHTANPHTNFKISASGESIFLSDSSATLVDRVDLPVLMADMSFAREIDGSTPWSIQEPTPAAANVGSGFDGYADTVVVSMTDHFYPSAISVELSAGNSQIFYTLDGSDPDLNATEYSTAISIESNTVLKAISLKENHLPGPVIHHTYFINENTDLPVISLSTDPDNLFDYDIGIFADGPGWTPEPPHRGANYHMDWERPAHVEFFDDNKNPGFSENCGIATYGGWTRSFAQKSVAVKFKADYNASAIEYPLFAGFEVTTFKSFILRNSGNDFDFTHIRDAFMQTLIKDLDIDYLEYRPAVAFINGEYWGIYNIREKISEHYIANRHGVDRDNIDMLEGYLGYNEDDQLEGNLEVIHGDSLHYLELVNYLQNNDMTTDAAYAFVDSMLDLDEVLLYYVAQVYFNSQDWPANNTKVWREKSKEGKWRWIMYDVDFGFNLYEDNGQAENHVYYIFSGDPTRPWSNPVWSTFIPRKLVENLKIKNYFINLVADLLNTKFKTSRVLSIMNAMADHISNDIGRHRQKWGINDFNADYHLNTRMTSFAEERPGYLRDFMRDFFGSGEDTYIGLNSSAGGRIKLNSLYLEQEDLPWSGNYFLDNEIHLKAIPESGYKFDGWSGSITSEDVNLDLSGTRTLNLVANFSIDTSDAKDIVINEINYNSSDLFFTGDWIELYNRSEKTINLSDWKFSDSKVDHIYNFPSGTILAADQYLVLVENDSAFSSRFTNVMNYIGEMDFGLSGTGEFIKLEDEENQLIDSLTYDDLSPWPAIAGGFGATLELIDPSSDNSLAVNWQASAGNGSPGQTNSVVSTLLETENGKIPEKFLLFQNYPNPFNSATKIRFQLDKNYNVSFKIFDINGKTIKKVLDKNYDAGEYSYSFKLTDKLASGVYFYQILLDDVVASTKIMILIR